MSSLHKYYLNKTLLDDSDVKVLGRHNHHKIAKPKVAQQLRALLEAFTHSFIFLMI